MYLQIYWGAAGVNVAAVVIVTIGIDVFRQLQQVSLATSVLGIDSHMRARLNSVYILSVRQLPCFVAQSEHWLIMLPLHSNS